MKAYKRIKKLTEVVKNLVELKEGKSVIADIGADHGYLSESLSRLEKVDKIFAVEISIIKHFRNVKIIRNLFKSYHRIIHPAHSLISLWAIGWNIKEIALLSPNYIAKELI